MKVINLLGGPCVGKTTVALGVSHQLKKMHYDVEYIPEYAREMIYEERQNILDDQIYIFAKQNRRLTRLQKHKIDFVVADSPLITSLLYLDRSQSPIRDQIKGPLSSLITTVFNSYNNLNIRLLRNPQYAYNTVGRVQQSLEEAEAVDRILDGFLDTCDLTVVEMVSDEDVVEKIVHLARRA